MFHETTVNHPLISESATASVDTKPARGGGSGAIWLIITAVLSVQVGAAFAKSLFGHVSPTAMSWLRLVFASLILLSIRPFLRRRMRAARPNPAPRRNWPIGLAYSVCLVGMNWSIYQAFERIPLGVGVTLEFLGPLAVAVAGSRRLHHLGWAALAALGVVGLEWSPSHLDRIGVAFALLAGACWGGYIVLGAKVGLTWPDLDAVTLACTLGALGLAIPALVAGSSTLWHPKVLAIGLMIGLMSSVLPYGMELIALRTVPPRVFGILMSLEPVAAALAALVILSEHLGWSEWAAMACIVVASIGATRT